MKRGTLVIAAASSVALHGLAIRLLPAPTAHAAARPALDVELVAEPPRPPPLPAPPDAAAPPPSPPASDLATPKPLAAPAPARAATPASIPDTAPILTAAGSDAPVDFSTPSGDGLVFTGSVTEGRATPATRSGVPNGSPGAYGGAPSATARSDLGSSARPASPSWSCGHLFPAEAEGVNTAVVRVAVSVSPTGAPTAISILSDPGRGFAAAARACARGQRYIAARDEAGRPIASVTSPFSVRFTR